MMVNSSKLLAAMALLGQTYGLRDLGYTLLRLSNVTALQGGQQASALSPADTLIPGSFNFTTYWTTDAAAAHYKDSATNGTFPLHIQLHVDSFESSSCSFDGDGLVSANCTYLPLGCAKTDCMLFRLHAAVRSSDPDAPALPSLIAFSMRPGQIDGAGSPAFWSIDTEEGSCYADPQQNCTGFRVTDPFPLLDQSPGWHAGL